MNAISNRDTVLDTREILDRIDELQGIEDTDRDEADTEELAQLQCLIKDVEGLTSEDPWDGIALVREDYFEEYARELARDIGAIRNQDPQPWPLYCIDWKEAAAELVTDYMEVDFDGQTYYFRA